MERWGVPSQVHCEDGMRQTHPKALSRTYCDPSKSLCLPLLIYVYNIIFIYIFKQSFHHFYVPFIKKPSSCLDVLRERHLLIKVLCKC